MPFKNVIHVGVGQIRSDDSNDSGNQKPKEHKGEIKTASSHIKPRCCLCSSCFIQHETQYAHNLLTMTMCLTKEILSLIFLFKLDFLSNVKNRQSHKTFSEKCMFCTHNEKVANKIPWHGKRLEIFSQAARLLNCSQLQINISATIRK